MALPKQQDYFNNTTVTFDMVLTDYHRWREFSGSCIYTFEQIERAFTDFIRTCICAMESLDKNEVVKVLNLMDSCSLEHGHRQAYRLFITSDAMGGTDDQEN